MVNVSNAAEYVALATIQGAIVALPHPAALERLGRLRSPAWALVAPGSILVGTFGILALPLVARGLAVLAQMATPVLAAIAVLAVVHGRQRRLLLVPVALGAIAAGAWGWPGELAASLLTALGCLTLGAALVRLTPARWLYLGVLGMAAVDVLLLAVGVGQPADALLRDALASTIQPTLAHAELGSSPWTIPTWCLPPCWAPSSPSVPCNGERRCSSRSRRWRTALSSRSPTCCPRPVPLALVLALVEWGARRGPRRQRVESLAAAPA